MVDLTSLTPDDLQQLRRVLGIPDADARTALWKPLTDLRPATTPKKRLYRPHFEWSAEDDGLQVIEDYPRLYWDAQGVEHRVDDEDVPVPATWTPTPPLAAAVDPLAAVRAEFDALSAEDRQLVLAAQKQARLAKLHGLVAALSETDFQALVPKAAATAEKASDAKARK